MQEISNQTEQLNYTRAKTLCVYFCNISNTTILDTTRCKKIQESFFRIFGPHRHGINVKKNNSGEEI